MQMNLNCREFQRIINDNSEEEPEAPRVRDTVAKKRYSEEKIKLYPLGQMNTIFGTRDHPR